MANIIKNQLQIYKEEVKDYQENAEIMEMIFSLGMNNEEEDVYLAGTKEYLGSKQFDENLSWEIVKFLWKIIDEYDGWVPLAEFYCWFNRAWGTGIV